MTDLATLQQHQLLGRLLGYAREQAQALAAEELDQFIALMDARERVITQLVSLAESPPPANVLPFPTIAATADPDVHAAMRGIIRSIMEQDDENERVLREQMEQLHQARALLGRGYATSRGYGAAALVETTAGRRLDAAS